MPEVAGASERIKFNAMFSTFVETTGMRVTAVYPDREFAVSPKLPFRAVLQQASLWVRGDDEEWSERQTFAFAPPE